jgi:histidyl-tRNA synthetase
MFMASGIPISSFRAVCSSVDKLDKMPWEEIRNELLTKEEKGIDEQAIDKLGEFVQLLGLFPTYKLIYMFFFFTFT